MENICWKQKLKHHRAMQDHSHLYQGQKNNLLLTALGELSHPEICSYIDDVNRRGPMSMPHRGPTAWSHFQHRQNNTSCCAQEWRWISHVWVKALSRLQSATNPRIWYSYAHAPRWSSGTRAEGPSIPRPGTNMHILQSTGILKVPSMQVSKARACFH